MAALNSDAGFAPPMTVSTLIAPFVSLPTSTVGVDAMPRAFASLRSRATAAHRQLGGGPRRPTS